MSDVTWPVAYTAVPEQSEVLIRAAHGDIELSQEYDGEYHAIYICPENALKLIRAVLRVLTLEDVRLHKVDGGVCYEVHWPGDRVAEVGGTEPTASGKPKDRTAAERQRRYRDRKRNGSDVTEPQNTVTDEPEPRLIDTE